MPNEQTVKLIKSPTPADWMSAKLASAVTMGYTRVVNPPDANWKYDMLGARHSPIRLLEYHFLLIGIPGNTATHFVRHVHAQPFVSSLRNDRQDRLDGDFAPRNTPVNMLLCVNAEELMVMANKRLCAKAAPETRRWMRAMCDTAIQATPEIEAFLVPHCVYCGGTCHELQPCGAYPAWDWDNATANHR